MSMHEPFEQQVERHPEATALVWEGGQFTYRELEERANQVAHALRALGVGPDVLVGLCMERGPELVVGLLGILKAGGAYVPLDAAYPRQRLAHMMEEARVPVLLTQSSVEEALPPSSARVLRIDEPQALAAWSTTRPERLAAPENLAYVLYTSGSTGRPKGVMVEHRSVSIMAGLQAQVLRPTADSHILLYASANFDVSVSEVLLAWTSGGTLYLVPESARLPGPALLRLMERWAITHAILPPSVLAALPHAELSALRVLVSAGETCPASLVTRWGPGRRFLNAYGPTETTIYATFFECTPGAERPPPLGPPLPGVIAHVLEDITLQPLPEGEPGELYLGGIGVSRGYLHQPGLTARSFIPSPTTGERLYRTGDRVRMLPGGLLEFLGRMDHQLKIRGHRVEPGEVEKVLARHPAVRAVVVVGHDFAPGDKRLVAYLAVRPGMSPGSLGWRQFARELLPEHMVPSTFVELPALPLTFNGKVDRRALPAPGADRPELATPFRPAHTPLQHTLEGLWNQVLGVTPVGLDDDFLELGGDSLRAVSLATRVREALGVELSAFELLRAGTLAQLAEQIEARRKAPAGPPPLVPLARPEALPLSFAQQRLWFLHRLAPQSAVYNLPFLLRLTGPLEPDALARGLGALLQRHEALRTTFPLVNGQPVQHIAPAAPPPLPLLDLRPAPPGEREARLAGFARQELARPFDLEHGPLVRAHLVRLDETEHVLLLAIHHAVCDGASMSVLARDLAALYEAQRSGETPALPALPVQYADYALWQRQWLRGETLEAGLAFWKQELEGAPRVLELPVDRPRPEAPTFRGATRTFHIPAPTARALDALSRAEGATPFMALLAALGVLLHRCTGSEDVPVGAPVAGRDPGGLDGLIGFFVNTLALRVRLQGNPTFRELLSRVRERTLAAYAHQDVPFEKLVEALQPEREGGHTPLFQVMLTLQRPPPEVATRGGLRLRISEAYIGVAPVALTWNLWEDASGLEGTILYDTDLFDASTIDRLVGDFVALLEELSAQPDRRLSQLEHPGHWGPPEGAGPRELEAALLADSSVQDCAVRLRRPPGSRPLRVAYVVPSGTRPPELPPPLAPEVLVPLNALPLTSRGEVDEEALRRVEVLDEDVARRWEALLRQRPGVEEVVVGITPHRPFASRLYLPEVLPGFRAPSQAAPAEAPPGPAARTDPRTEAGSRPMALCDGGPLVLPEGAHRTLVDALLRTASTAGGRGITYVGRDGSEQHQSYAALLHEARCVLTGLRARGLGAGDRVILQIDSLRDHCTTFWACLLGGLVPVTVAIAPTYESRNAVVSKLHGAWELLGHPLVLASEHLVRPLLGLRALLPMEYLRVEAVEPLGQHPPAEHLHPARPHDVAFLQLSSGSTGVPKCIQETHSGVIHHVHATDRVHRFTAEDVFLNWLPFDHVGPLILYHLRVVCVGSAQVHAPTDWILAEPLRWLDLMEAHGVTYSWTPNFGYALVSEALRSQPGRTWKLGALKRLMNGGEQATLPVIREFLERTAPSGVRPDILQPAYGMAELCTAITYQNGFHPERGVYRVAKHSLGGVLEMTEAEDTSSVTFLDVGPPNPGVELRIVDADNRLLPEGVIGRIQARGPIVTPGYLHNDAANREAFVGQGWFNTGDSGFLLGGRLTVTGREKEIIIIRGSHLYCHDVEEMVRGIDGVEPTLIAACGVEAATLGAEGFAIFFTPRLQGPEESLRLISAIRTRVTAALGASPTFVVPVPEEEFPRTTSGKLQRGALKQALADGRFAQRLKELALHEGGDQTLPEWFHQWVWRPRAALSRGAAPEGACLLFLDERGLGTRLCDVLRQAGRRCVTVEAGAGCTRLGEDAFQLPPDEPEAYERLLTLLREEGVALAQVLHLWTYDGPRSDGPGSRPSAGSRERGALSLLWLSRALARTREGGPPLRLQAVSSHAQPTAPDEPVEVDKALLLSVVQTIPQEVPWLDARHLDLTLSEEDEAAPRVLQELEVGERERQVAWRQGRRLVPRLERVPFTAPRPPPLETGGVYLVSGGLGALGLELSHRLLQHCRARLLLIGRTPPPEAQEGERGRAWRELLALAERSGGEVHSETVDVCDLEGLRQAVSRAEARWGRTLDGVFHLAGVLEERLLAEETREHFTAVLRPKVEGTQVLELLLADRPEAFLVGFSSVNGSLGGFSVAAYSAANRFLEHFLHTRRAAGASRRFCLSWSRWAGTVAAHTDTEERLAALRGYQTLPSAQAWNSLLVALSHTPRNVLIGLNDQSPHVRSLLEGVSLRARQLSAFFTARPGPAPSRGAPAELVCDGLGTPVACQLYPVEDLPRTEDGGVDLEALWARVAGERRATRERTPPRGEVEQTIASLWRQLLGVEEVGALDNFFELGGHSLLLARAHRKLEQLFDRKVALLELFRHPTVRALAAYLTGEEEPSRPGAEDIQERARKQRTAQGRHRQRRALNDRKESDDQA